MVQRTRVGGGSSALGRTFAVGAAAGGLFNAGAEVLGSLQEQAIEEQKNKDLVTEVEDRGEFTRKVDEDVSALDPSQPDYAERVREAYDARREETLENTRISTEAVRNDLELSLTKMSEIAEIRALQASRESTQKRAVAALGDAENVMLASIEDDPDGAGVFEEEFAAAFAAAGEAIPNQAAREAAFDEVMDRATMARIRGFTRQGRRDEAEALLEKSADMFSPAQRKALERDIRVIDGEVRRERAAAATANIADLEIAIEKGEAGVAEVQQAMDEGVFQDSPRVAAVLFRRANEIARRRAEADAVDTDIMQRLELRAGLKSGKEADRALALLVDHLPEGAGDDRVQDLIAYVTSEGGHVPTSVSRMIQVGGTTTDEAALAQAAALHGVIAARSPTIDTGANKTVQFVDTMTRRFGMDPILAARRVIELRPDPSTRTARLQEFDKELDFVPEDFLSELGFDEPASGMVKDAQTAVREFYALTGDLAGAQLAAGESISRVFGVSTVGGGERTVKFPPEIYGLPNNIAGSVPEDIRSQAITEMIMAGLEAEGISPPDILKGVVDEGAGFVETEIGLETPASQREVSLVPQIRLSHLGGSNPPKYAVLVLNVLSTEERPIYSAIPGLTWSGATEEEFKETEAWKTWSSRQRNIAVEEEARARRLDEFMRENERLNLEVESP